MCMLKYIGTDVSCALFEIVLSLILLFILFFGSLLLSVTLQQSGSNIIICIFTTDMNLCFQKYLK